MEEVTCMECSAEFDESYLFDHFGYKVCDECRDCRVSHDLIARTYAKERYLLTDDDLNRAPKLKYISKQNPHVHDYYSEMRLYLELQVEERAMEIWGSRENIEEEKRLRKQRIALGPEVSSVLEHRDLMEKKRKQMKALLHGPNRDRIPSHSHKFGEKTIDRSNNTYTRVCSCGLDETGPI